MPLKITSIRTAPPFKLQVQFSDGAFGVFDCALLLEEPGSVSALRDRRYFAKVSLENGVPTWPNHFDVSPQWLREEMEKRGDLRKAAPVRRQR
jgi:hypothetical protein